MDSIIKCCCSLFVAFMFCFTASGYAQDPVAPPPEEQAVPRDESVVPAEPVKEEAKCIECDEGMFFDKDLNKCVVKEEPKAE